MELAQRFSPGAMESCFWDLGSPGFGSRLRVVASTPLVFAACFCDFSSCNNNPRISLGSQSKTFRKPVTFQIFRRQPAVGRCGGVCLCAQFAIARFVFTHLQTYMFADE